MRVLSIDFYIIIILPEGVFRSQESRRRVFDSKKYSVDTLDKQLFYQTCIWSSPSLPSSLYAYTFSLSRVYMLFSVPCFLFFLSPTIIGFIVWFSFAFIICRSLGVRLITLYNAITSFFFFLQSLDSKDNIRKWMTSDTPPDTIFIGNAPQV